MLKVILLRVQKEMKSTVENVSHHELSVVHEQNLGRTMNVKGDSGETLKGNEEDVIENWRKGNLCYKVVEYLAVCVLLFGGKQNL